MPTGAHAADDIISSGQMSSGPTENWCENDLVESGGTAVHATIIPAGATTVAAQRRDLVDEAWSREDRSTLSPNRGPIYPTSTYIVSSGQMSSGLVEGYHGFAYWNEIVLGGGTAVQNQVTASGHVYVSSAGVTQSDTISSGGFEVVSAGGSAYYATVSAGGVLEGGGMVVDGLVYGQLNGVQVGRNGPFLFGLTDVESGGIASDVTVVDNAGLNLQGGIAISTTVLDGALDLEYGGKEQNAYLSGPSAYMDVGSGCSAYYDIVLGGTMVVESGLESQSGPAAAYTYVASGGVLSNADVAEGAQIGAGGLLINSAFAQDTEVEAGGVLYDTAVTGYITSGKLTSVAGGVDSGAVVSSGGLIDVEKLSTDADIQSGGLLLIEPTQYMISGSAVVEYGSARSAYVESGGTIAINDIQFNTIVWNGSSSLPDAVEGVTFESGSVLSFRVVDFQSNYTDPGVITAPDGLVGSNTFSGANLVIGSAIVEDAVVLAVGAGRIGAATVENGGLLYIEADAADVENVTVLAGGLVQGDNDFQGGYLQGATVVYGVVLSAAIGAAATMTVESGGLAANVSIVDDAASTMAVLSGGSAALTYVGEWDTLTVASGGMVSGTEADFDNADIYVYGSAADTTLANFGFSPGGGEMFVLGSATGVQVEIGGTLADYGAVSGVRVSSGGLFIDDSGTPATGVTVLAGGVVDLYGAILYSGASATLAGTLSGYGEVVEDGPGTLVMNAASTSGFTGEILLSAGTVELARAGEAAKAQVVFAENGNFATLLVETADRPASATAFSPILNNFDNADDRLDLAGLAFVSGARATVSGGVLTLKDGGYSARFTLAGATATRYLAVSDGKGGTMVHAAVGAGTQALTQAAAAFAAPAAASHSGHDLQSARVEVLACGAAAYRPAIA